MASKKKDKFEVTKEEAIKLNKELAKTRGNEKKLTKEKIKMAQEELGDQLDELLRSNDVIKNEQEEIQRLIHSSNLLDIIVDEIQNKKVVGEKETIETIFIIANCRNVKNIKPTSSNLLVNDESGLGKDWIVKAVLEMLPDEYVESRTKITPELFTYWHNPKFEPDWSWNEKVFYLEDAPNKIVNSDVFKVFSSGGSKATVLVKQTPIDIEIKGKPSMIITSAEINPTSENLRRYPICFLDSSDEQTLSIMIRQSKEDIAGETIDYNPLLKKAISFIKPVKVIIPFADKLPYYFPKNRYMRTHYKRFLDYIKSVACLYQYQRERDDNGSIVAIGQDYDIARKILLKTTSNPSMIPLTRLKKDILDFFAEHENYWFAISDIEDKFPISDRWLRSQIKSLVKDGFLKADKEIREGVKKPVPIYSYNEINKIEIPKWSSVNTVNSFNSFNSVNSVNTLNRSNINGTINGTNTSTGERKKNSKKSSGKKVKKSTGEPKEKDKRNKRNKRNWNLIQKKAQIDKINELKKYCKKIKSAGHNITYIALCDNFDKTFIEKCKENKILIVLPNGFYEFRGGNE